MFRQLLETLVFYHNLFLRHMFVDVSRELILQFVSYLIGSEQEKKNRKHSVCCIKNIFLLVQWTSIACLFNCNKQWEETDIPVEKGRKKEEMRL